MTYIDMEYVIRCWKCSVYLYDSDRKEPQAICSSCQDRVNELKREQARERVEAQAQIDQIWEERVEVPTRGYMADKRRRRR